MSPEKTVKLLEVFPKLFPKEYLDSPIKSGMYFGFQCGDGWYNLIYVLCASIQRTVDNRLDPKSFVYDSEYHQPRVQQVKEKFGSLRFYVDAASDEIRELIGAAQSFSWHICEYCGSVEDIVHTKGWIRSTCKECADKNSWNY